MAGKRLTEDELSNEAEIDTIRALVAKCCAHEIATFGHYGIVLSASVPHNCLFFPSFVQFHMTLLKTPNLESAYSQVSSNICVSDYLKNRIPSI